MKGNHIIIIIIINYKYCNVFKGNVAVYKDLNLVTVTIKIYFSHEHSERT